jgi:hypothetical protein
LSTLADANTSRTTGGDLVGSGNIGDFNKPDRVHTIGGRVVNTSVKNLIAQLEGAYQFGTYSPTLDLNSQNAAISGVRKAWALQAIASYNLAEIVPAALAKYKPSVSSSYTYLSGERNTRVAGAYHGWDAMYEDQTAGNIVNRLMGYSNAQIATLNTKVVPMEDLSLNFDYAYYWLNRNYPTNGGTAAGENTTNLRGVSGASTYVMTGSRNLGQELDATLTYDYTEDVQFSVLGGVFFPGSAFEASNNDKATEVIGSMKVTF